MLTSVVFMSLMAASVFGTEICEADKSGPLTVILRSGANSRGKWRGQIHVKREYGVTGTRAVNVDVDVDVHRNGTYCDGKRVVHVRADIVASAATDSHYHRVDGVGSYSLHTETLPWRRAKHVCDGEGAHLAVVNSKREADELRKILSMSPSAVKEHAYLGASDIATDGILVTVTGARLDTSGYNVWDEQSRSSDNSEDCVAMGRDAKLKAVPCDATLPFFCEKEDKKGP